MPAYCTHRNCRNYKLISKFSDPQEFTVYYDSEEVTHDAPVAAQVRGYERDQMREALRLELPNTYLAKCVTNTSPDVIAAGSYGNIVSENVIKKVRSEALQSQDNDTDDYADLGMLQSETNYISTILQRRTFATYIHSPEQLNVLKLLHAKRK